MSPVTDSAVATVFLFLSKSIPTTISKVSHFLQKYCYLTNYKFHPLSYAPFVRFQFHPVINKTNNFNNT